MVSRADKARQTALNEERLRGMMDALGGSRDSAAARFDASFAEPDVPIVRKAHETRLTVVGSGGADASAEATSAPAEPVKPESRLPDAPAPATAPSSNPPEAVDSAEPRVRKPRGRALPPKEVDCDLRLDHQSADVSQDVTLSLTPEIVDWLVVAAGSETTRLRRRVSTSEIARRLIAYAIEQMPDRYVIATRDGRGLPITGSYLDLEETR